MSPPAKRPRVDYEPVPISGAVIASAQQKVASLPLETIQQLLIKSISTNPTLLVEVLQAHDAIVQREKAKVIDFDHYSKQAWYLLYKRHARASGSQQCEAAYDVASEIGDMFRDMLAKANTGMASYGTRRSAVLTMRKIFKSTLLTNDTLGSYVHRNTHFWDEDFVKLLKEGFASEELEKLAMFTEKDKSFLEQVHEVASTADGLCILPRLKEAVELLEDPYKDCDDVDDGESQDGHRLEEVTDEEGSEEEPVETGPGPWDLNYSRPPTIAQLLN